MSQSMLVIFEDKRYEIREAISFVSFNFQICSIFQKEKPYFLG
jgi:hypothetical protein